jgi:MFS family permease
LLTAIGVNEITRESLLSHSGWRLLMFFGAAPALLTFLIRLFVPESERWTEERGRGATSHWATRDLIGVLIGACGPLATIYIWNSDIKEWAGGFALPIQIAVTILGLALALAGYLYPVVRYMNRSAASESARAKPKDNGGGSPIPRMLLGACLSGVALLGTWGSLQWAPAWAAQLGEAHPNARAFTQIASGIGAIVGTICAALLGDLIGRRLAYFSICLAALGSALLFFATNTTFSPWFLATVFLAGGMTAAFYGWLPLYLPELFRTRVRATGQGFAYNFGRILAAIGTLQTGLLMQGVFDGSYPKACMTMSMIYLVGMAIIWLAPETQGKPLPE